MPGSVWLILILALAIALAEFSRRVVKNARQDVIWGIALITARWYVRVVHNLRIVGAENIPGSGGHRRTILVVNHTAGIDPILVQAACPFEIRWMMASDMQVGFLRWAWDWLDVINVERFGRDTSAIRRALRHLANGGVVGIFPEGAIERPPRQVLPFHPGVGLLAARSGAHVLPVVVDGTPQVDHAWSSLFRRSRSTIRFLPPVRYGSRPAAEITEDLRRRYIEWTGWPANDQPWFRDGPGKDATGGHVRSRLRHDTLGA